MESGSKQEPKRRPDGTYEEGQSGNPAGRPLGSVDPVKEIGRKIAARRIAAKIPTKLRNQLKKAGVEVDDIEQLTMLDLIMEQLASSSNPAKLQMFLERTYGKVPNVNVNTNQNVDFVVRYASKFTDAELEAIKEGADALEILVSKLPDVE